MIKWEGAAVVWVEETMAQKSRLGEMAPPFKELATQVGLGTPETHINTSGYGGLLVALISEDRQRLPRTVQLRD